MELRMKRSRLGWAMVGGVALIAILSFVLAWLRFRSPRRPAAALQAGGAPVLLITIDTLRADHVGCYGSRTVQTPNIDTLAAQGVRFDDALAQVPLTLPSHAVIFSGTYPMWHGARGHNFSRFRPDLGLMAEAFQRHGYVTAAFVSSVVLESLWGLNRGFQTYDDRFDPHPFANPNVVFAARRAEETVTHLLTWFRTHDPRSGSANPFFVWLHLYDPHTPYDPPEPFRSQYAPDLYSGAIAYSDSQLGRLLDYLREIGIYDRALIILAADHGESLLEHGEEEHGYFIYRSTLHVPLIIKLPRGMVRSTVGQVIPAPVGLVDLAPTVLDLVHFQDPLSRQFQGTSLVPLVLQQGASSERPVYSETYYPREVLGWSPLRSVTSAHYQFIQAPRPELYEFPRDPSEKQNVYGQHKADATALRDRLIDMERRYTNPKLVSLNAPPTVSPDDAEKLKALGYVAYLGSFASTSEKDLPDPKDRLPVYQSIVAVDHLASAGQFKRSDALIKPLLAKEPGNFYLWYILGHNAMADHRPEEAERALRECLRLNPTVESSMMDLATVMIAEGRFDEAHKWFDALIRQDPNCYVCYCQLGLLAKNGFEMAEAKRDFEKAVELKADYAPAQQGLGMALFSTDQFNAAIAPLEAAASLGSRDPELYNALGSAYLNTKRPKQAIPHYQKALALKNDYPAAHLNLAFAYLKTGDRNNALSEYRAACETGGPQCEQYANLFH
jgi:arylsulfatase A-like enzyme/Flp pilus assembly protein TadD